MLLRSSHGSGRYAASEVDVFVANLAGWAGGVRGVLYFHGAAASATSCRDYTNIGELHLVNAIAEAFPVLSIDAGGANAFGNSTAVARCSDGRTHLQGTRLAKAGTVLCVGSSMGALTALNYAKANPTHVAAVVGLIPAIDLNDIVTNNRGGLAANVNTAYSTYNEATHGATSNPATYAATFTTPTRLYYASDDTTCLPGTATAFDTACASATAVSVGALGHTQAAIDAVPRDALLDFLNDFA